LFDYLFDAGKNDCFSGESRKKYLTSFSFNANVICH